MKKKVYIKIEDSQIEKIDVTGYKKQIGTNSIYIADDTVECDIEALNEDYVLQKNGILIKTEGNKIEIFNDAFRSIPLFIAKSNNSFHIFSDFRDLYSLLDNLEIDRVGLWEYLLYGFILNTRTLFSNVSQMVSASRIEILNNEFSITPYWNFYIKKDDNLTKEAAVDQLHLSLSQLFSHNFEFSNQHFVMGLSGGLDSRVSIAYLSKVLPKNRLDLYTYGYTKRTLEYSLSKKVANTVKYNTPTFHKLDSTSYLKALEYMPYISGGQIGMQHCHSFDFLRNNNNENKRLISNFYSDALFGYAAANVKEHEFAKSNYHKILDNHKSIIKEDIYQEIINDLQLIVQRYNYESNFSCIDEFIYIVEKNPKFHIYLSYLYNDSIDVNFSFLDFSLLKYMLSVPIEFRHNKNIIDELIERKFPQLSFQDLSSRLSIKNNKLWRKNIIGYWSFRLTWLNSFFILLNIKFQIKLKYLTEDLRAFFFLHLSKKYIEFVDFMFEKNLIQENQKKFFLKKGLRWSDYYMKFHLSDMYSIINQLKSKD